MRELAPGERACVCSEDGAFKAQPSLTEAVVDSSRAARPLRIFLSYGHEPPDHVKVAERIRDDLKKRGHDVWFDIEKLKTRNVWENEIERAIVESDRVLLLMTPYSIRRADPYAAPDSPAGRDGYCLNEIAKAVERNKLVVPIMLAWVDQGPPTSICRIQWLDMRDCVPIDEKKPVYEQTRFPRLVEALEENRLDFEGGWARIFGNLTPLNFQVEMERHITGFAGREWLIGKDGKIDQWLREQQESRVFWVIGGPGTGKSAIATQLAHRRGDVGAIHFCVHGHAEFTDPEKAIRSIAFQLATHLPAYQKRLQDLDLEADTRLNSFTLFYKLIVSPLAELKGTSDRPPGPLLVVIDALDEATHDGVNEIADAIARCWKDTPRWLRLVITSRKDDRLAEAFSSNDFLPFTLDTESEPNKKDVRDYLSKQLAIFLGASPGCEVVENLLTKSEGVYLYAKVIMDEIRQKRLSLDELHAFPRGMREYYWRVFRRHFPPEAINKYKRDIHPILSVVLAQREPLPLHLLAKATGVDEFTLRRDSLRQLGSLFPIRATGDKRDEYTIAPFHKSLVEWLTACDQQTGEYLAGDYTVNVHAGATALLNASWKEFDSNPQTMCEYSKTHLPAYLLQAGRWSELAILVASPQLRMIEKWVDRADRLGLECLEGLIECQCVEPAFEAMLATQAARIHSRRGEYSDAEKQLKLAVRHTSWRHSRKTRAIAFHELGSLHLYRGDRSQAARAFRSALRLSVLGVPVLRGEAAANRLALAAIAFTHYRWQKGFEMADRARKDAEADGDAQHTVAGLRFMALALDDLAKYKQAEDTLGEALELSQRSGSNLETARLLDLKGCYHYGQATIRGGDYAVAADCFQQSLRIADSIGSLYSRIDAMLHLGWCAIGNGKTDEAVVWFDQVGRLLPADAHADLAANHRLGLAAADHERGDTANAERRYQEVLNLAQKPENEFRGHAARALTGLGAVSWHSGKTAQANDAWNRARGYAKRNSPRDLQITEANIDRCRREPQRAPR